MKTIAKNSDSKPSTMASFTQQFVSEGAFLNAIMELKAYERGWGPAPSATSMAILAEQRGSAYTSSRSATVPPRSRVHESHSAKNRPANTLRVVIPPSPSASSSAAARSSRAPSASPTIEVVPPTPITPRSPIYPSNTKETKAAYTLTSYYDLARRAPLTERVPYLPQFCPHTAQPFVLPCASGCARCALQLLACDIWFSWSSASTGALRAPPVPPAKCTVEMRSVYYALGISLGDLDRSSVDQGIVKSIIIPRRSAAALRVRSDRKAAVCESSRTRTLFQRALHVLSAPLRAPVMAMPR